MPAFIRTPMSERVEAVFAPRVQGVGFRRSVLGMARGQPAITGWLRNEHDGTVRFMADGDAERLAALIDDIVGRWRTHITSHRVEPSPARGDLSGFTIGR